MVLTLDINECTLNISGCGLNCTNTIGSYYCSCYSGYQIAADNNMTCSGKYNFLPVRSSDIMVLTLDINECVLNISGCSQNCTNTIGSFYCSCYHGYQLAADLISCSGNRNFIISVC